MLEGTGFEPSVPLGWARTPRPPLITSAGHFVPGPASGLCLAIVAASTGDPQIGGEGDGVSDSRDYAAIATPVTSARAKARVRRERTPTVATHQNNTSRVRGGPPGPRQSGPRACEQIACFGFLHRSTCPWIPRRFLRSDATVIGKVPQPLATYCRQRGKQWLITLTRASPSP